MRVLIYLIVLLSAIELGELYHIEISDPNEYLYKKDQDDQGNYYFSNNVFGVLYHEERGTVEKSESTENSHKVRGNYFYDDSGFRYNVSYEADENGYRARFEKTPILAAGVAPSIGIGSACIQSLQGCSVG